MLSWKGQNERQSPELSRKAIFWLCFWLIAFVLIGTWILG